MTNATGITTENELRGAMTPVFDALIMTTSKGEKIDLAPLLLEMAIYEDIFSPVLTGYITIQDTINMFDNLPISGAEKLTTKIYSWNYPPKLNKDIDFLHRTFDILRVTDIVQINDYTKQYTLHFASPELKKNESFKLSKGYTDTSISDIVTDIFTGDFETENPSGLGFSNSLKKVDDDDSIELVVEKTKYSEPVISFPYMSSFDLLNWLSTKALRHDTKSSKNTSEAANFLLFENKRGFQFTSIDSLLEQKSKITTKFLYGSAAQNIAGRNGNRGVYQEQINDIQIHDCYDIIENMRSGVYASKLYSYNLEAGTIEEHDYNYIDTFENTETTERLEGGSKDYPILAKTNEDLAGNFLSNRMLVAQSPSSAVSTITSTPTSRDNDFKDQSGVEEYLQKRTSQLGRLFNFRMLLDISANSKHKVGDLIDIDIKNIVHTNNKIEFQEESNKYYSGIYLITSIKHIINKHEYDMHIEVAKDSYKSQIE